MLGAVQGIGLALKFDPAFAGSGADVQLMFERLQIARVVIIELLRQASVFEVQGFSGHAVVRDAARYTAEGLQCGNLQFLLLGCVLSVLPVQRVQRLRPCKLSFNQRSAQYYFVVKFCSEVSSMA